MQKEVLIYGYIDSYSSSEFIDEINEATANNQLTDIVVRLNTPGGDVDYGWGMIAKFKELKGQKLVKVDGKAHSMGLYYCAYADNVEALDVSEFLLHRAAYPSWIENDPNYFTQDRQDSLTRMNQNLRAAIEAKIDVNKFEKITGTTLDKVFSMDGQLNVRLTAAQAKEIGLIQKITPITPQKKSEIKALMDTVSAKAFGLEIAAVESPKTEILNHNKMTIEQLKSEHPSVYAQIFDLGVAQGAANELDRIQACLTFIEADPKGVSEAIASGKPLSQKQMAEFSMKVLNKGKLAAVEEDGAPPVTTPAPSAETEEQRKKKEFLAGAMSESTTFKPTK